MCVEWHLCVVTVNVGPTGKCGRSRRPLCCQEPTGEVSGNRMCEDLGPVKSMTGVGRLVGLITKGSNSQRVAETENR